MVVFALLLAIGVVPAGAAKVDPASPDAEDIEVPEGAHPGLAGSGHRAGLPVMGGGTAPVLTAGDGDAPAAYDATNVLPDGIVDLNPVTGGRPVPKNPIS